MSESTESTTESNPFTKPGFIISAALVVALIAAAVVIFFLPNGQDTAQPAPASSAAGLLRSPQSQPTRLERASAGCPQARRQLWAQHRSPSGSSSGKWPYPLTPRLSARDVTDGDGFRSCFANSPTGALYAAANMVALGSSGTQDELKLAEKLLMPGPGRDSAMKRPRRRLRSSGSGETTQVSGFSSSPTASLRQRGSGYQTTNGALAHSVLSIRWIAGDWKVKAG